MKIRIKKPMRCQCPHCGVVLETDDPVAGMRVKCPKCEGEFVATPLKPAPRTFSARTTTNAAKPKRKKGHWLRNVMMLLLLLFYIGARYMQRLEAEEREAARQKAAEADAWIVGAGVLGATALTGLFLWASLQPEYDEYTVKVQRTGW